MLQPPLRVRPQRLLADNRAPCKGQPSHAGAFAVVQYSAPNGRTSARQHPACPHPTPPRTVGPTSYRAYTYLRAKATIHENATRREGRGRGSYVGVKSPLVDCVALPVGHHELYITCCPTPPPTPLSRCW
jgi:hypothetical protein